MSLESIPNGELSHKEEAMYQKFVSENPGITRADFKELREIALNSHSSGVKDFFSVKGVLMEEIPTPEEKAEILEQHEV